MGLSNVPGGSTSSGGYSLDQCNQACLDQAACRSFVVNKETGVCELWDQSRLASALTESAVHSAFICPERGYNSTVSYLCSNKYAGKNFPEADHIAEFTELSFYECDTKCQVSWLLTLSQIQTLPSIVGTQRLLFIFRRCIHLYSGTLCFERESDPCESTVSLKR